MRIAAQHIVNDESNDVDATGLLLERALGNKRQFSQFLICVSHSISMLARFAEWFGAVLALVRFSRPVAPMWSTGVLVIQHI